jgi:hypothetical protein
MTADDGTGLPATLALNAWAGRAASAAGQVGAAGQAGDLLGLALHGSLPAIERVLYAETPPDWWNWRDPRVGWGLILPDNDTLSDADRARGVDAPGPVRDLLSDRPDAPIFRYQPRSRYRWTMLKRYFADRDPLTPAITASGFGIGPDQIPYYLLICASPAEIPWELQYLLNSRFAVGRLDLDADGLTNYIRALRADWDGARADPFATVVWATDHGQADMSHVMRRYVADPVFQALKGDPSLREGTVLIDRAGAGATPESLAGALQRGRPGLIVTTSHGVTCPLDDPAALAASLGLPVGEDLRSPLPADLLSRWQPDGAIWYAHACCSAGAGGESVYAGISGLGPQIAEVLSAVAKVGPVVAPLPRALLGAKHPARAFVGHVEPTFDYTIRQPETAQALTTGLVGALHDALYQEHQPGRVGHAFRSYFDPIATAASQQVWLRRDYDRGRPVEQQLLTAYLTARDRMSTVILGDPTVRFRWPAQPL